MSPEDETRRLLELLLLKIREAGARQQSLGRRLKLTPHTVRRQLSHPEELKVVELFALLQALDLPGGEFFAALYPRSAASEESDIEEPSEATLRDRSADLQGNSASRGTSSASAGEHRPSPAKKRKSSRRRRNP